jgi:hypothetical protein
MYRKAVRPPSRGLGEKRDHDAATDIACDLRGECRSLRFRERSAALRDGVKDVVHVAVAARLVLSILLARYALYGVPGLLAYRWRAVRETPVG